MNIFYEDGLKYVRGKDNEYDLIIVDSTDPFGPGEGLFTKEFYGNCYKALNENGILVNQHESTFYDEYAEIMKRAHSRIKSFSRYRWFIRRISRPTPPGTGCSDSRANGSTRSRTSTRNGGWLRG